jgi:hypothetical protein
MTHRKEMKAEKKPTSPFAPFLEKFKIKL